MLRSFFKQSSWYLSAHILISVLGLISFPVWTRVLSVKEFGILNLVDVTVAFVGTVTVFGLSRASIRFYSEFKNGYKNLPMTSYYTTLIVGAAVISTGITLIYLSALHFIGPRFVKDPDFLLFLILGGIMLIPSNIMKVFFAIIRVEQKAKMHGILRIIRRYLGFAVSLMLVVGYSLGLRGIYYSSISIGYIVCVLVLMYLFRKRKLILGTFSFVFLIESIKFGFPLISADLANTISSIGDRYVIQYFMGSEAVGIYSAGYGVTTRVTSLISVMLFAVTPIFLSTWEKYGRERTEEFLSTVLDFYLMLALPAIIFFSFFGGEIVALLAGEKYLEARVILPFIMTPVILHGAIAIYTAGIYIHKKTKYVMYFTLTAGILNIIMNIVLVPLMGLKGAALATLISYLILIILSNFLSSRFLTLRLNYSAIFKYLIAAFGAVFLLHFIHFELFLGIIIKLAIGAALYTTTILLVDQRIRQRVRAVLKF